MPLSGIAQTAEKAARRIKVGQLGSVVDLPFNLSVLIDAGVVKPIAPGQARPGRRRAAPLGRVAGGRVAASAIQRPDERRADRRARDR